MKLTFAPMSKVPGRAWDALVTQSPDGWVWALAAWQRLILDVSEWALQDFSFAAFDGERMVGVMPLQYQQVSRRMGSSGWGVAGPVACGSLQPDARTRVLGAMLVEAENRARQQGATRLELGISPLIPTSQHAPWGVNPFVQFGFHDVSTNTRILDLSVGLDAIWSAVSQNAKRKIKLARSRGITVQQVDWPSTVDAYYRAHCETYVRTGVTPHPRKYFEGIANELAPIGYAVLTAGVSGGRPIAFRNDARFGSGALYHTGCSFSEALETGVNYLLVWESIEATFRAGLRWYEIGEVFPAIRHGKEHGLTEFKSRFGGDLHRYFKGYVSFEDVTPAVAVAVPVAAEATAEPEAPAPPLPAPARTGLLRRLTRWAS